MPEFPIEINFSNPDNTNNPGTVLDAKIETKNGFLDIYYTDPKSKQKTRITIQNLFIKNVLEQKLTKQK